MTLRFLAAIPLMLALQGSLVPGKTQTFSDHQMFQHYAVAYKFRGNIA